MLYKKINTKIVSYFVVAIMFAFVLYGIANAAPLYRQLDRGVSGSDVTDLQEFLAKDPALYPEGLVTGYFGPLTEAAVTRFQARYGIAQVGRVGPITLQAINNQMITGVGSGVAPGAAPAISGLTVNRSSNSVTISWNTNENSTGSVFYSTSPIPMSEAGPASNVTIGGTRLVATSGFNTSHTANITSLSPNTTYYYTVYSRDANGNESMTWPATFMTSN